MEHLLLFSMIFLYLRQGMTAEKKCGDTRYLSGKVGEEVVLPVQHMEVKDITWMTHSDKNIFATTEPGKSAIIRNLFYNGRLNATADGSLIITRLIREDQRIYKGSILRRTSGQCAQFYNLTVYEEQVYFFSSSSTTSPERRSPAAKTTKSSKQVTAWIIILLCVSATAALLLIFAVTILVSTFQNMKERTKTRASHKEDETLYTELDIKCLQKVPPARNVQERTTVTYSHVKVALNTKKSNV